MNYRSEIDGLRAIAVIPVILFHAGFSAFGGGFVGVDVFFVISGYLITTIILSEMEQGTFSVVEFYERRARRILPALFLVMLCSLPFSWIWLMPGDMEDFSQSLIAVSSFSSNILFWRESGYWDASSELKPLLHTWSLAVEEQYYVLFPLFLILMWRYKKRWIFGSFLLIAATSLAAAQWGAFHQPDAAFFLLPTRGWELAVGASVAFYFLYQKSSVRRLHSHKAIDEMLGLLGLSMIGYSIYAFNDRTPFPSFYTLVPTIGTALIILFSSTQTLVGRLLSIKPLVAVGLISFSAYLWHQPMLVFARHRTLDEPSQLTFAILAFLSIPLAYLSWRYVEKPFRAKGVISRKAIFTYSVVGSGAFIVIGLIGHSTSGFDTRLAGNPIAAHQLKQKLRRNGGLSEVCNSKFTLSPECRTDDAPEILVWGDSFAMHLVQGIRSSNPGAKIIQFTKSICGPFFDIAPVIGSKYPVSWAESCLDFSAEVRSWLKHNTTVKFAVLSSPFRGYLSKDNKLLSRSGNLAPASEELVVREFENTLQELVAMGITPIVFSPPPENGTNIGRCLAKADWFGVRPEACNYEISKISQTTKDVYAFLEIVEQKHAVVRIDDMICDDSQCHAYLDKTYIYRDARHLSNEGSAHLGRKYNFYRLITES